MTGTDTLLAHKAPSFDFDGFSELAFPRQGDIVYVLCFKAVVMGVSLPFYVGESSRLLGRLGGFVAARFSVSTDFKVGHAARMLLGLGCEVVVRYKAVSDRRAEEKRLIAAYELAGLQLLNTLEGYRYQTADPSGEIAKVETFVAQLLRQHGADAL